MKKTSPFYGDEEEENPGEEAAFSNRRFFANTRTALTCFFLSARESIRSYEDQVHSTGG